MILFGSVPKNNVLKLHVYCEAGIDGLWEITLHRYNLKHRQDGFFYGEEAECSMAYFCDLCVIGVGTSPEVVDQNNNLIPQSVEILNPVKEKGRVTGMKAKTPFILVHLQLAILTFTNKNRTKKNMRLFSKMIFVFWKKQDHKANELKTSDNPQAMTKETS